MQGRVDEDEGEGAACEVGDGDRGGLHRLALAHQVNVDGEARLWMEMAHPLQIEPKPGAGARTSSSPPRCPRPRPTPAAGFGFPVSLSTRRCSRP
jgi:hypothetical protein